jgi:hypothetical protein
MWAHIDKLYYAANRADASSAGFDDELFYKELSLPAGKRKLKPTQLAYRYETICSHAIAYRKARIRR